MTGQKKPTDILKEEHQSVLQKLDALEEVISHLDRKEEISSKLGELTAFFKTNFWIHFTKEEAALFPEFDNFMPHGAGPLAVMIEEHEVLRKTNAVMQEAVAQYLNLADNVETRRTITESGMHFINFLRNHISKEENILFTMTDMHLDQTQLDKVVKLFHEIETAEEKGGNPGGNDHARL